METEPTTVVPLLAVLTAASVSDLWRHRIPNPVSLGGAVLALVLAGVTTGLHGLLLALGGLGIGLVALLPAYVKGGMAAGDVKLMAAVGAFLGPAGALDAVALSLVAGGILGIGILIHSGSLGAALGRYLFGIRHFVTGGVWLYLRPAAGEAAALRFPYALAIAVGAAAAVALPPIFRFPGA